MHLCRSLLLSLFSLILIQVIAVPSNAADNRQTIHLEAEFADRVSAEIELTPASEKVRSSFAPDYINSDPKLADYLSDLKANLDRPQHSSKSAEAVLKLFQSTKHFISREVPAEVVAFYTAQFVSHLRKLSLLAPWEVEDPASLHAFFDHLFTPSGYIGFAGFMAANRLSAVPLMKMLRGIEHARMTTTGPIKAKLLSGTAKLFRSLIIPSITMGAGIAVSSIIQEFWFDQDIQTCSDLTLKKDRSPRQTGTMKTACMAAYERWSGSNKLWEWTPQLTSLLISAQLSQGLVAAAKAGTNGLKFKKIKTPGGIKRILRASLKGVRVFFGRNPIAFNTSPIGIALGFGVGKVIQLYVFLETINVVDHFFVRPWQTRRLSKRVLETLAKVEKEYYADWNKKVAQKTKGCESGTTGSIIANFFTHSCRFGDRDFLSLLKKFSHRLRDYRNYMLEPFFIAAKGWNHYTNEFITVGTGATQVYATMGALTQTENRLLQQGKAEFGTTLLTKSNYFFRLGGIQSPALSPYYEYLESNMQSIEDQLLESASWLKSYSGKTLRDKVKNYVKRQIKGRNARFGFHYLEINHLQSATFLVHMLSAADRNEDITNWPLTKALVKNKMINSNYDVDFLRYQYVTTALRGLRNIVGSDVRSFHRDLKPLALFRTSPREFLDHFGQPTKKLEEFELKGQTDIFLDIYSILEEPWPLESGEGIIYDLYQYIDAGIQSSESYYPKSFAGVSTPSLTEYLIASMTCGPKSSHLNLFQRRSTWSEWFFNWFEKGNDKFVTQYQKAIRKGDIEKAYSIINKFKFSNNYTITGNIITHAFGLKEMFVPPRIVSYPRGFSGGISGPAVVNYTPCGTGGGSSSGGSLRGYQVSTYDFLNKQTYYGLVDVLRNQLDQRFQSKPESLSNWWSQQVEPGFASHINLLKSRYKKIVKEHFTQPFDAGNYFTYRRYRGRVQLKEISAKKAARIKKSNPEKALKTLIPAGIKNSLNFEFDYFARTLKKLSKALSDKHKNPQIYKVSLKKIDAMKEQFDEISNLLGKPDKRAEFKRKFTAFNTEILYLVGLFVGDPQLTPIEKAEAVVAEIEPSIEMVGNVLSDFGDTEDYKTQIMHFVLSRFYQLSMEFNYYQDLILTFEKRSV